MLEQKGMIPGTTYIRTWYVYQHFLFDSPFDEIYRRLLFFTLGGAVPPVDAHVYDSMIPGTYYVPGTYVPGTTLAVVLLIVQLYRYLFIR